MEPAAGFSFTQIFYEEGSFGVFLLVTIILGGGAACLSGRAIALTWRPAWQIFVYSLILGCAVRFIHFSLFGGTLLSTHYFLIDSTVCVALGILGFRTARVSQMVSQYCWVNQPDGPLRWRRHAP
jgi:NO-binding membrane sensor protein with MHYT domain